LKKIILLAEKEKNAKPNYDNQGILEVVQNFDKSTTSLT